MRYQVLYASPSWVSTKHLSTFFGLFWRRCYLKCKPVFVLVQENKSIGVPKRFAGSTYCQWSLTSGSVSCQVFWGSAGLKVREVGLWPGGCRFRSTDWQDKCGWGTGKTVLPPPSLPPLRCPWARSAPAASRADSSSTEQLPGVWKPDQREREICSQWIFP